MSTYRLIQNVLLYSVLIYMILNKGMTIADFVLYIGLVETFSVATSDLFANMVWMNMNKLQMDDFRTFMDWKEDVADIEKDEGTITDIDLNDYEFRFENVSFHYPGHEKYVLKNLNLTIKAGRKLAVVGVNGAGKTTLTKLLMRLYEPTAALDALAEDRMYQEFNRMVEGKTSIFISHRLSSTRFCDQIVLFENGSVVETGTHEELMKKDGKYAQMYHIQAQYYRKGEEVHA